MYNIYIHIYIHICIYIIYIFEHIGIYINILLLYEKHLEKHHFCGACYCGQTTAL